MSEVPPIYSLKTDLNMWRRLHLFHLLNVWLEFTFQHLPQSIRIEPSRLAPCQHIPHATRPFQEALTPGLLVHSAPNKPLLAQTSQHLPEASRIIFQCLLWMMSVEFSRVAAKDLLLHVSRVLQAAPMPSPRALSSFMCPYASESFQGRPRTFQNAQDCSRSLRTLPNFNAFVPYVVGFVSESRTTY